MTILLMSRIAKYKRKMILRTSYLRFIVSNIASYGSVAGLVKKTPNICLASKIVKYLFLTSYKIIVATIKVSSCGHLKISFESLLWELLKSTLPRKNMNNMNQGTFIRQRINLHCYV